MRFAYALHMHQQNLVLFPCSYIELFELVIPLSFSSLFWAHRPSIKGTKLLFIVIKAVIIISHLPLLHPPCHKISLFKRPFRGSRFERLVDAFVSLVILIFLYPQNILISVRWLSNSRICSVWWFLLITVPSGLRFQKRFSLSIVGSKSLTSLLCSFTDIVFSMPAGFCVSDSLLPLLHIFSNSSSWHNVFILLSSLEIILDLPFGFPINNIISLLSLSGVTIQSFFAGVCAACMLAYRWL